MMSQNNFDSNIDLLKKGDFETIIDGKKVSLFRLKNDFGLIAEISNYGGRVLSLWLPDREGNFSDVVHGPASIHDAMDEKYQYFGAIIGRYANRVQNAQFILEGNTYNITRNNGENHLHGGVKGFNNVVWDVIAYGGGKLELSYFSKDGEEGFPGNLKVLVTYELTNDNELKISYSAVTDRPTVVNLTHHSFFNLAGAGEGTIYDHELQINASSFTPIDENGIPSGLMQEVKNTPFDFSKKHRIGDRIDLDNEQLAYGNGFDHNYIINKDIGETAYAASVFEPSTGRIMEVYTNEPGIQFYSGNFLDGTVKGKKGILYQKRSAFCLETQHYPNSPNEINFPSTALLPGETYSSICIYRFLTD
ncbi:MAG: aldose epimerase family protein [Bacteroidota bacterium]